MNHLRLSKRRFYLGLMVIVLLGSNLVTLQSSWLFAAPRQEVALNLKALQPVNINEADVEELQTLKGIGPALAERIVSYRQQNGAFKQVQDLTSVKGIGDAKLQKIRDQIKI